MAEKSFPWTNNGTGDGTNGGYTALEWGELWRAMLLAGEEDVAGVFRGHRNSLAVTGTASPLSVDTGAACVHGKLYINTSSLSLSVATPVVGTTGGHVVLELDWVAQTVRAKAYRNTDGVNTPPSLTQSLSTVWQIRLATFTITTGGVITVTDARRWVPFVKGTPGRVLHFNADGVIADDAGLVYDATNDQLTVGSLSTGAPLSIAVTNAETDTNAANYMRLSVAGGLVGRLYRDYNGAQNYLGIESFNVGGGVSAPIVLQEFGGRIGVGKTNPAVELDVVGSIAATGNVSAGGSVSASGSVSAASVSASGSVSAASVSASGNGTFGGVVSMLGSTALNVFRRQGGSGSDWSTPGTSNFTPAGTVRLQAGSAEIHISDGSNLGSTTVTFPAAFAQPPLVMVSFGDHPMGGANPGDTVALGLTTASQVTIRVLRVDTAGAESFTVHWIAIGPG